MHEYKISKSRKYSALQFERTTLGSSVGEQDLGNEIRNLRKGSADLCSQGNNYKTEVCKYWEAGKPCPFAETCVFAHGEVEIRSKDGASEKYKTRPCKNFHQNGYCPYGQRCQFIHNNSTSAQIKIKRKYIYDWFGHDPAILALLQKKRLEKSKIKSQTQLRLPSSSQDIQDPQPSQTFSFEHNLSISRYIPSAQNIQIMFQYGFTKPRLYSL